MIFYRDAVYSKIRYLLYSHIRVEVIGKSIIGKKVLITSMKV